MIKIAICDDEEKYLSLIEKVINFQINKLSKNFKIYKFQNSAFLLDDIREGGYFDILCLDIEMPQTDGLTMAQEINILIPNSIILFITSFLDYAINGYELNIFRFVLKEKVETQLKSAITDAVKLWETKQVNYYTFMNQNRLDRIEYRNILYLFKESKNVIIVTVSGEEKKVRKTLRKIITELDSEEFIFIDRGFIVNITHVQSLHNNIVLLDDNTELPVSRSHIQQLKETMTFFWGKFV